MTNMIASSKKKPDSNYIYLFNIWLISLTVFFLAGKYETIIYDVFPIDPFLHWHTALEFITIIISFTLFIITYYTYTKNHRARLLVFSAVFFIVGFVDFIHTMNYNGMQGFFGESSIAKATTFWMISRLIMSFGLLVANLTPYDKKTDIDRRSILYLSILVAFTIFYLGNYRIEIFPKFFVEGVGLTRIKVYLEYVIMLVFCLAAFLAIGDYVKTKDRVFIIYAAGLFFAVFTEASFTLYRSVYDTYNLLGHIHKIISSYLIFRAIFLYNLDIPYKHLREARIKLKAYAENLEALVETRTKEIRLAHEKMMEELDYAKLIQESLLPYRELSFSNVKFISDYIPCQSLSGDLYQYYKIDEDNIGMYIADVSGHGVSAAMLTVFTERLMNPAYRVTSDNNKLSPQHTLKYLFTEFNKANFPDEMHIVIFKAVYNLKTRAFAYCSGGMNTIPVLVRRSGEVIELNKSKGFPICKFDEFYKPEYEEASVVLGEGDRIFFYTDGLADSFKDSGVLQIKNLISLLTDNRNEGLRTLEHNLKKAISRDIYRKQNEDDITYFIMEVDGANNL